MKLPALLFGIAFLIAFVHAKSNDDSSAPVVAEVKATSSSSVTPVDSTPNPDVDKKTTTPSTTTSSPSTSTSKPSSTSSRTTTPAPSTSTPTPATSTKPTPTPSPATSTTPPTPPHTPTSPAPPTTPSTTPSPQPTPKPAPKEYYWNVTNDKGDICILAKADITLKLAYTKETDSGKKEQITKEIKILPNATSSGTCDEDHQILEITLNRTKVTFVFTSDNNTKDYHLSEISSNITLEHGLGNQSYIALASSGDLKVFQTKVNTSYECRWSEPAVLKETDTYANTTEATLRINMDNIRFEAFRNMAGNNFAQAYTCEMDNTDLVPIMVGIAMGILVAVVLIAYLVGRRNTTQGYTSM